MSGAPIAFQADHVETIRRLGWWIPERAVADVAPARPRSSLRIAAIVGHRLWTGLRCEARLLPLTPENWRLMLAHGRPDLLLVESCWETATGHWYQAQSGMAAESALLAELLEAAGRAGLPRVFWHTRDQAWHLHHAEFARRFDFVFCADAREADALRGEGLRAELLAPAVQPSLFNPVRPAGAPAPAPIALLYDGIVDLMRPRGTTAILRTLRRRGLRIIDSHSRIFESRLREEPGVGPMLLGCVTQQGRVSALRATRLELTLGDSHLGVTEQRWRALESAACRVPIVHLGTLPEGDPRAAFVVARPDEESLREAIVDLQQYDMQRERVAHAAWRAANTAHSFSRRLGEMCRAIGVAHDWVEHPLVSVVTPTFRKNRLDDCVRTFERQAWPNKELVIVFNGDFGAAGVPALSSVHGDVRVLTVPRERHTGSCMNAGIAAARGEYCFKMDDDDVYGAHYVSDMMLHALALDADVFGKPSRFYAVGSDPRLQRRVRSRITELCAVSAEQLASGASWMSGNSLSGRRAALLAAPFPETVYSAADTAFVLGLGATSLRVAILDSLNLVTMRAEADAGHTWSASEKLKSKFEVVPGTIEEVLL